MRQSRVYPSSTSRTTTRRRWLGLVLGLVLVTGVLAACVPPGPHPGSSDRHPNPVFCDNVKNGKIVVSQGARMYCFGPQGGTQTAQPNTSGPNAPAPPTPTNVAASNLAEDVAPNGARGYGQSETSVARNGSYVVEAWNDATGFFSPCGSPQNKDSLTGLGFSSDGGATFTDLGGLPNNNCDGPNGYYYAGDPSVETATIGGVSYFYISSIFAANSFDHVNKVAMSVCTATGSGVGANLACGQPVVIARSSSCPTMFGFTACSFLDKPFLTVDPVRQRLYSSYTEFLSPFEPTNSVGLAVCDISNPTVPSCHNGGDGNGATPQPHYLTVASPSLCENEGAYPAVDRSTGDVYVAFEHNFAGFFVGGPCLSDPIRQIVTHIPFAHLTLPVASGGVGNFAAINVTSMEGAIIPGYNRFPPNDFPRIAVSTQAHTVSIVWNDARFHPLGDILLQSWSLGGLTAKPGPVQLDVATGGLHLMPALRNADSAGKLNVTWYERAVPNTTVTDVVGAFGISPTITTTPANSLVTNVPTDWNAVATLITPNFGDYTDNYVVATGSPPWVGTTVGIAWADGRSGAPQAFFASR